MTARKRSGSSARRHSDEAVAKRRSSRQAPATADSSLTRCPPSISSPAQRKTPEPGLKQPHGSTTKGSSKAQSSERPAARPSNAKGARARPSPPSKAESGSRSDGAQLMADGDVSDDPELDAIPTVNPDAPRHKGEWYWLMKAEPEPRLEQGVDVSFSIDDLRAKKAPEGWDGVRAYAARNHMKSMNAGDKAFFYHSNCKEPGIVGTMEIVKEFSEDKNARRPGNPYYDPSSSKTKQRWSLVHVSFRKKFAVPITLKELRELGRAGGPLENMQMLKQSRLSVSRVGEQEWQFLCRLADGKAWDAGLQHEL